MADFDAEKANELLDIVLKTKDFPALLPLNQVAMVQLTQMVKEVEEQLEEAKEEKAA